MHLAVLEDAQELRLLLERDVGDLVEEERAAVGELEAADAIGFGVGEGAADVSEELALEDAFGESAGVDGYERPVGARRRRVEPAGDDFLAGAVLAGDEDVGVGGRDLFEEAADGLHGAGVA